MPEHELQNDFPSFEDFKNENGLIFWWAGDLAAMLGYENLQSFRPAIDRARKACLSIGTNIDEHFIPADREDKKDFKLTRFACYLAVMNGDPKKEQVALAQVYFTQQTRKFELYLQGVDIDRLLIRDELKEGFKTLQAVAKDSGVTDFQRFNNAGYVGMYNMGTWMLAKKKGLPDKERGKLQDYMGRTELAANLFRVTQTEEKLKNKNVTSQSQAEAVHKQVGEQVRNIVIENTGTAPESLPLERQLPEVKKELKKSEKALTSVDQKKIIDID